MSFCISSNGETFTEQSDTREQAFRTAIYGDGRGIGDKFYIGQPAERKASDYFDVDSIIEQIAENAYEEVGEAAEAWPDLLPEDTEKLEKLIGDFLNEHSPPTFFAVENVEQIEVTPALFAKYGNDDYTTP